MYSFHLLHSCYRSANSIGSAALLILLLATSTSNAQSPNPTSPKKSSIPPARTTRTKTTTSKSANVKRGEIAALEASGDTLILKERTGKSETYVLTDKTHYTKDRHASEKQDFKVGNEVFVHFRRSRTDGALLITELADVASWNWLSELRKNTTVAVIKEIDETGLTVTVGTDAIPVSYTISDKTRWSKDGKEVSAADFKPGDKVYVVPRSLPSGSIMARAVADTNTGADTEKERLATSVHGTIQSVDSQAHKLTMKTLAGDTRSLAYTDETEFISNRKLMPLAMLKSGLKVTARIKHLEGDDEIAWRITIDSASTRKTSPTKKKPTLPPAGSGNTKGAPPKAPGN